MGAAGPDPRRPEMAPKSKAQPASRPVVQDNGKHSFGCDLGNGYTHCFKCGAMKNPAGVITAGPGTPKGWDKPDCE